MVSVINRWTTVLALLISIYLWLGMSIVVGGVMSEWVKSDLVLETYGSVSLKTLVIAFSWSVVVGIWVMTGTSVSMKRLVFVICASAAWVLVLAALTVVVVDQFWSFRWVLAAVPIVAWVVEISVVLWLLRIRTLPLLWGAGLQGVLMQAVTALTCLVAVKALLLALNPGVVIRM